MDPLHLTYAALLLLSISYPLLKSFESKLQMWRKWKYMIPAILLTAIPFITWDVWFARHGVWSFNHDYVTGWFVLSLPWEEWLFFILVPYACFFIYEAVNHFYPRIRTYMAFSVVHWVIFMAVLYLAFRNWDKTYTAVAFFSASFILLVTGLLKQTALLLPRFYLVFFISLIPFFLINGILTALPVVMYNDAENLGIRLITIPVEDAVYLLTLLMMNFGIYEGLKKHFSSTF
ncbi:MAG TPA: lycopene cyclase domain-containing protein [Bacteroidales bacterium]|nr:lycopene cyclase domain-containing protein [Bacteroidales bacterium]HSA44165.1 lycopene cyclase domain-containing protein [Bacteroidales bacterium]